MSLIDKSLPLELRVKEVIGDNMCSWSYLAGMSMKEINKQLINKDSSLLWWINKLTKDVMKEING